jgi:hypothetical protein
MAHDELEKIRAFAEGFARGMLQSPVSHPRKPRAAKPKPVQMVTPPARSPTAPKTEEPITPENVTPQQLDKMFAAMVQDLPDGYYRPADKFK